MKYADFIIKLRQKDPDAVRMLVAAHGKEMLSRAKKSLAGHDKRAARRAVTRAVQDAIAHLDDASKLPCDEKALFETLDDALDTRTKHMRAARENVIFALLCIPAACALWINVGILMSMRLLPYADIGYTWFNHTFFVLF